MGSPKQVYYQVVVHIILLIGYRGYHRGYHDNIRYAGSPQNGPTSKCHNVWISLSDSHTFTPCRLALFLRGKGSVTKIKNISIDKINIHHYQNKIALRTSNQTGKMQMHFSCITQGNIDRAGNTEFSEILIQK